MGGWIKMSDWFDEDEWKDKWIDVLGGWMVEQLCG